MSMNLITSNTHSVIALSHSHTFQDTERKKNCSQLMIKLSDKFEMTFRRKGNGTKINSKEWNIHRHYRSGKISAWGQTKHFYQFDTFSHFGLISKWEKMFIVATTSILLLFFFFWFKWLFYWYLSLLVVVDIFVAVVVSVLHDIQAGSKRRDKNWLLFWYWYLISAPFKNVLAAHIEPRKKK